MSFAQHRAETGANYRALSDKFDVVSEVKVRIGRAELDIDRLGTKVDTKIAALEREIESKHGESQREIERVDTKVDTVTVRAAQISGGISLLGFALAMISWLWKGH
jgi:Cu/Ag efflux pump CusA